MLEKIRLHEILSIMYVLIGKPFPTELEDVRAYTPGVEAILLKEGWKPNVDFQDQDQRCIGFVTENTTNSFVIQNVPNTERWQGTVLFFEPWPNEWTPAHKVGFLHAYNVYIKEEQLSLWPGMPMCIMHIFDDKIVIGRFFFGQISYTMKSAKHMFDLVEHFGINFVSAEQQSGTTQLHTVLFLNHFAAFKAEERDHAKNN